MRRRMLQGLCSVPFATALLILALAFDGPSEAFAQARPGAEGTSISQPASAQPASNDAPTSGTRGGRGARGGGGGRGGNANTLAIATAAAAAGAKIPAGPFEPTWDSMKANYKAPAWFGEAKFAITMHWGLYSVAAHHNEWWVQHMYGGGADTQWQIAKYGPLDQFGYKDFIPLFKAEKWDPAAWAALFKSAGARTVAMTAQHHDNFAMWDSKATRWNSVAMGPHKDFVGDLSKAVRAEGMHFGVTNHGMEHYGFIRPPQGMKSDLDDPQYDDFYWTQNHSDKRYQEFLEDWVARNVELIDQYQPDFLWFDNGVNSRALDPVKLKVAAYYYNQAAKWGKPVTMNTKGEGQSAAYLYGSLRDYERGRASEIEDQVWDEDTSIAHNTWCYTDAIIYRNASEMVRELVDCVSKNGTYMLNIMPKGDGTIPDEQVFRLKEIGAWLDTNGDAIYGAHAWVKNEEGPTVTEPNGARGLTDGMLKVYTPKDMRFTVKDKTLYAIVFAWPADGKIVVTSLPKSKFPMAQDGVVSMLGNNQRFTWTQDEEGLKIQFATPTYIPCEFAYALKIDGLKLN